MPPILEAVFSYNRGPLLANTLASLRHFHPDRRLVVFDDNSSDTETQRVLDQFAKSGGEVIRSGPSQARKYGNLYDNMNRAVALAASDGHELVHFVQDDTQIVWRRPDLLEHVNAVFRAQPDAYQVQLHFAKRLGHSNAQPLRGLRAQRILTPGGDLGVIHVARVRERGLGFGPTERDGGLRAAALGLAAYATADPVVARVPWPRKSTRGQMRGRDASGGSAFLIRPLDADTIARLVQRDPAERPYGEDWYEPWGWRCWAPYPTDPSLARWGRALLVTAVRRRSFAGLTPRRVGSTSAPAPAP
jgi:hypothetical protein